MTTKLVSLCFDANEPLGLARFWAGVLGWEIHSDGPPARRIRDETHDEIGLMPTDGTRFIFVFLPVPEPKTEKNRLHLDLVSESPQHQRELVERFVALGARRVDVGQGDADHVVLADPEGNEFCVVVRGEFLADTGLIGAVVFEPAEPATGRFWSATTGWPVVYDQDGDVAIRDPSGKGPFITFGPPGVPTKTAKNRLHLDVAPTADSDQEAEVQRLIELGARRVDIGQGDVSWVVLADPDGNEFCVLTPR